MNQPFNGRTAVRGAIMVMGSTYVTYALGMLTSILLARTLGPDDFGRYTYMVWMAGLLIMFSNNGLTTTVIRFASESLGRGSPETARSIHGWLRRWQLACVGLVTLAFLLTMPFFTPAGWEGHLAVFAGVVLVAAIAKAMFLFDVSVAKGYGLFQLPLRKRLGGKALYRAAHRPDAGKKAQMERQLCLLQRTHIARITIIAYMRRYLSHYRLDIFIKLPVPAYIQRYRS